MAKSTDRKEGCARWTAVHRALPAGLAVLCASFAGVCWSQQVTDEFRINKVRVELPASERFETITFYETDAEGNPRAVLPPSRAAPIDIPPSTGRAVPEPFLEHYGVLLVHAAPGLDRAELEQVVDRYNRTAGVARRHRAFIGRSSYGNPAYGSGNVDQILINEVFVRFKRHTARDRAEAILRSLGAEIKETPQNLDEDSYLVQFPGKPGHVVRGLSNRLDSHEDVEYAQPNFIVIDQRRMPGGLASAGCSLQCPEDVAAVPAGDPYLKKQWHLNNLGLVGSFGADVNAFNAWRVTQGDSSIVVAILDEAIQENHPDLPGTFLTAWSAFEPSPEYECDSVVPGVGNAHGTAVAGLLAAVHKNGKGVRGIAPGVTVLPVRSHCGLASPLSVVKSAINYAVERAQVLSMSWSLSGTALDRVEITNVINQAVQAGKVLVIAADNEGGTFPGVAYPASLAKTMAVIAVSATDTKDALQRKSPSCSWTTNSSADTVAAPGVLLYTTDVTGTGGYCTSGNNSDYVIFDGTSGSTPIVAGIAALMLSMDKELSPAEIRNRLRLTARHPDPASRPGDASGWGLGWGRVDACRALNGEQCMRSP